MKRFFVFLVLLFGFWNELKSETPSSSNATTIAKELVEQAKAQTKADILRVAQQGDQDVPLQEQYFDSYQEDLESTGQPNLIVIARYSAC